MTSFQLFKNYPGLLIDSSDQFLFEVYVTDHKGSQSENRGDGMTHDKTDTYLFRVNSTIYCSDNFLTQATSAQRAAPTPEPSLAIRR